MKNFLRRLISFWNKTYPKSIQAIFLLVFLGGIFIVYRETFYFKQVEDANAFFAFLITLILLILTLPVLKTLIFYLKEMLSPMATFQKYVIILLLAVLIVLTLILLN